MLALSRKQMAEIDRLAVEEFGIEIVMMMEHAGFDVASLAYSMLGKGKRVAILAGHGNNGGDGLCAARHLINNGYKVRVYAASGREKFVREPLKQLTILERMGVEIEYVKEGKEVDFADCDLIIDALLGYNLVGDPRGAFAYLINKANETGKRILAVDLPSGLDADTGTPGKPCIRAACTLTLSYPKIGLLKERAKEYAGDIYVGYVSIPDGLYKRLGLTKNDFLPALKCWVSFLV